MKKLEDLPIGAIDDKEIEEAARGYINKNGYFIKYDEDPCVAIELAYKDGAKWATNEFLKNLWHPASEKPLLRIGKCLVVDNSGKIDIFKISYVYEMLFNYGKDSMKWKCWAYISDLIQEEGGKQ